MICDNQVKVQCHGKAVCLLRAMSHLRTQLCGLRQLFSCLMISWPSEDSDLIYKPSPPNPAHLCWKPTSTSPDSPQHPAVIMSRVTGVYLKVRCRVETLPRNWKPLSNHHEFMFAVGKLLWEMMWIREVNFLSRYIWVVRKAKWWVGGGKICQRFVSFLLIFFNICSSLTLWVKLSAEAPDDREDVGISLERKLSVIVWTEAVHNRCASKSWQFLKELGWKVKPHHAESRNPLPLDWPRLWRVFPEIAVIQSAQTVECLD